MQKSRADPNPIVIKILTSNSLPLKILRSISC